RYDAQVNFLGDLLVNAVSTSISGPRGMTFDAQGNLLISSNADNSVLRYSGGVLVSLDAASATPVSVDYATADGTALAATKYDAQSGTVTFSPGQTSRRILLATKDNLVAEPNETFTVQLSHATGGATIGTGTGTVTITDDDTTRQLAIADTSA